MVKEIQINNGHVKILMKIGLPLLVFFLSFSAFAARILPNDLQIGKLVDTSQPHALSLYEANPSQPLGQKIIRLIAPQKVAYSVAPGLRIFDEQNRFLLRVQLELLKGKTVGFTQNHLGQIDRLWLLSPEEVTQKTVSQVKD